MLASGGCCGGGIQSVSGTLILNNSNVTGNTGGCCGGGIGGFGGGTMLLDGSTVSGNEADNGGGIFVENLQLTLTDRGRD